MLTKFDRLRKKNEQLNNWEKYYCEENLRSHPLFINIPTGSRCNIKCIFCTEREQGTLGSDYRDMDYDEFVSLYGSGWQQAFMGSKTVALYGWGEPLFNRDYEKIFNYMTQNFPGLGISLCTNGIMFDRKWAEKMTMLAGSELNFSVNAASKETYMAMTGSPHFERVVENIRQVTNMRNKGRAVDLYVALSYVATTKNIHELPDFVDLAADLCADSILIQDVMMLNEATAALSLANSPDAAAAYAGKARQRASRRNISLYSFITHSVDYFKGRDIQVKGATAKQASNGEVPSPYLEATDCFDPWERFMVGETGDVFPCCRYQSFSELSLGNVNHQGFQDIWNGRSYRSLRRVINTKNPPHACAHCPRKMGLD